MVWKLTTAVLTILCGILLVLVFRDHYSAKAADPRLLGTWVSDRERTLADLEAQWQLSDERQVKLGELLGKLKVTFTETTITTKLDEFTETLPYTVVGSDKHSVVIRDDSRPDPNMEALEMSTFSKIQFEGQDSYRVVAELGGFTEYFRRTPAD